MNQDLQTLFLLGMFISVGSLVISLIPPTSRLNRIQYAVRTLGTGFVIGFVLGLFGAADEATRDTSGLSAIDVTWTIVGIGMLYWTGQRLQDMGWSKWWGLMSAIPYVGFLLTIVPLFWPGRPPEADQTENSREIIKEN